MVFNFTDRWFQLSSWFFRLLHCFPQISEYFRLLFTIWISITVIMIMQLDLVKILFLIYQLTLQLFLFSFLLLLESFFLLKSIFFFFHFLKHEVKEPLTAFIGCIKPTKLRPLRLLGTKFHMQVFLFFLNLISLFMFTQIFRIISFPFFACEYSFDGFSFFFRFNHVLRMPEEKFNFLFHIYCWIVKILQVLFYITTKLLWLLQFL